MFEERMIVLDLIDQGVITVCQALKLIEAMAEDLEERCQDQLARIEFPNFCLIIG